MSSKVLSSWIWIVLLMSSVLLLPHVNDHSVSTQCVRPD